MRFFHVTIHTYPLSLNRGQKKKYISPPEKKTGGTAYRGTTGSTAVSIAQLSTKCKGRFSKSLIHPQPAALGPVDRAVVLC